VTPCKADYVINVHHDGTLTSEPTLSAPNTSALLQLYCVENGRPYGILVADSAGAARDEISERAGPGCVDSFEST
jgi:hypothetical protein